MNYFEILNLNFKSFVQSIFRLENYEIIDS